MPEYRECRAHHLLMMWFYQYLRLQVTSFRLLGLWADASKEEAKRVGAADGHVYRLEATCKVKRGTNSAQTPLWPPDFAITASQCNPPSIQALELKGVSTTSRAIILNLGPLSLKVCLLTTYDPLLTPISFHSWRT
jgi:hypothetical protein